MVMSGELITDWVAQRGLIRRLVVTYSKERTKDIILYLLFSVLRFKKKKHKKTEINT